MWQNKRREEEQREKGSSAVQGSGKGLTTTQCVSVCVSQGPNTFFKVKFEHFRGAFSSFSSTYIRGKFTFLYTYFSQ